MGLIWVSQEHGSTLFLFGDIMKGTFFSKPLEWNIETKGEAWEQGTKLEGLLSVKNHGSESVSLASTGVALSYAEIKKVQARNPEAFRFESTVSLPEENIAPGETKSLNFTFPIPVNGGITDKKSSYYLSFGQQFSEGQLQLKVEPKSLYTKIIGLLDTFYRFKVKEIKATKKGIEYKLLPPTARDMANIDSLLLTFSMSEEILRMRYEFQVKRLDTASVTTKINKESVSLEIELSPKEYSLGRDMINQDQLLKSIESVLAEVKLKSVF